MAALTVVNLGSRDYAEMVAAQERLAADRLEGLIPDLLLLLEHPATYTLGRRSDPGDLLHDIGWYRDRGIQISETPRGGKVTFHGPGQLVAYPIVDLRGLGDQPNNAVRVDVAGFVGSLEEAMISALAEWGLSSGRIPGLTGLWVEDQADVSSFQQLDATTAAPGLAAGRIRKIGSIGLKIRRGVSTHGLSLNVSCDLDPFEWINSCGIETCKATSLAAELEGDCPSVQAVGEALVTGLSTALAREIEIGDPADFGLDRGLSVDFAGNL